VAARPAPARTLVVDVFRIRLVVVVRGVVLVVAACVVVVVTVGGAVIARHRFVPISVLVAAGVLALLALLAAAAGALAAALGVSPVDVDPAARFADAGFPHLAGRDALGRDLFTRALLAGRMSLLVGLTAALVATGVGVLVGLVAAVGGVVVDAVCMRVTDALLALPALPLLLLLSAAGVGEVTSSSSSSTAVLQLVVLLAGLSWMGVARLVRAEARQALTLDHVAAARALGASPIRVVVVHVLPLCLPGVLVQATLAVGANLLTESALSFLGLGVPPSVPTWGTMLVGALDVVAFDAPTALWPGVLLFVTAMAVQVLGDGLRASWFATPAAVGSPARFDRAAHAGRPS
jgi:peptide/nickel transport system permease protein